MPALYACPSLASDERAKYTSYVAVVSPRTSWPGSLGRKIDEFKDGTSNTIMVIECDSERIPWMEPRDLEFDDALRLLASSDPQSAGGHRREEFFFAYYDGRNILLADGSVYFVSHGVDRDVWSALLTIDDGDPGSDWNVGRWNSLRQKKLKLGNCVRFAIFVCLVFFPLPWVWINPTSAAGVQSDTAHGRS